MAGCMNNHTGVPVRSPSVDFYRWPESDSCKSHVDPDRWLKSNSYEAHVSPHRWPESYNSGRRLKGLHGMEEARVVDCRSCRQIFLRSYTFSRKESLKEKTKKSFGKVRERIKTSRRRSSMMRSSSSSRVEEYCSLKKESCSSLLSTFRRLILSCTNKVDVS